MYLSARNEWINSYFHQYVYHSVGDSQNKSFEEPLSAGLDNIIQHISNLLIHHSRSDLEIMELPLLRNREIQLPKTDLIQTHGKNKQTK